MSLGSLNRQHVLKTEELVNAGGLQAADAGGDAAAQCPEQVQGGWGARAGACSLTHSPSLAVPQGAS